MLDQLTALLAASLGGGAAILVLLALGPLLAEKVSPRWRYWAWAAVGVSLLAYPILGPVLGALFPAPIQLEVPQAVADGAYDRQDTYGMEMYHQLIAEAGNGGIGMEGQLARPGREAVSYKIHVHYTDRQGREVSIRDNDYLRTVTVDGVTSYTVHWTGVAFGGYRGVAVLSLLWMAVGHRRSRRCLLQWSTPAGEADLAALERARQETGCRKEAALYRCPKVGSPLLLGFAHPVILLPETMPEERRGAALAHELTHLKRRDTGYLLFLTCVRCVHWFNPLVWSMVRAARRDMELCCDGDLLAGRDQEARRAYGRAILDQMTAGKGGRSGLTTGFTGDRRGIFLRFRAIMDTTPKRRGRLLLVSASLLILLAGGLVSCAPAGAGSSGDGPDLSGTETGSGEMLPLEERFESYNQERGRSLPVSRGERAGEVRYRFADQEQGVEVLVGPNPGKGDPFPAEVLFQRRSFSFDMPVLPLARGGVEGSASLSLADLTGDGVPELVYIWGGGGTGAWEDSCRVFDLSTGEEYPVILDPELMLSQVQLERLERREDHLIYRVTGPGGQSGEGALWCPESGQEPEGGPALGQISLIGINEAGDALEWTASLTLEGPPVVVYGNSLGALTAELEFSPSLRAFTAAPPREMVLDPPA